MWLRKCGRKHLGKNFIIPENEKGIIFGMLAWFLQDELVAKEMNIAKTLLAKDSAIFFLACTDRSSPEVINDFIFCNIKSILLSFTN